MNNPHGLAARLDGLLMSACQCAQGGQCAYCAIREELRTSPPSLPVERPEPLAWRGNATVAAALEELDAARSGGHDSESSKKLARWVAAKHALCDAVAALPASRGGEPSEARFTKQMAHEASYIIREELRLRLETRLIPNEADIELYVAYNNGVRDCLATVEHFDFNARPEIYTEVDKERAALRSRGEETTVHDSPSNAGTDRGSMLPVAKDGPALGRVPMRSRGGEGVEDAARLDYLETLQRSAAIEYLDGEKPWRIRGGEFNAHTMRYEVSGDGATLREAIDEARAALARVGGPDHG